MTRAADVGALREAAFAALEHAYAPYSQFRVGAALMGTNGTVTTGCNVENASFPAGMCAERSAVATAVAGGVREFKLLVIASEAEKPTPPCGFCRQVLIEFSPSLSIVSFTRAGSEARWTLRELLPHPFTPAALTHL